MNKYLYAVNLYWVEDISVLFNEVYSTQSGLRELETKISQFTKKVANNHLDLVKTTAGKIGNLFEICLIV